MTTGLMESPRALAPATLDPRVIEQVLLGGDLSKLTSEQRTSYYNRVCVTLGLNPLTQPFAYLRLNGKEVLYAKKDATEQLRMLHGVSITEVSSQRIEDVFVVTAKALNSAGRTDASTGAVAVGNLKGEALANALMKAETKAKRRVTLSICGLGLLDETEVETIKQDPPPLVVEPLPARPPAPEGAVYIERIDLKRKGHFEWSDVTLSTGEEVVATGQMIALLEQIAQEQVPAVLTTQANKKGKTEITHAARWSDKTVEHPPVTEPLSASDIAF
jgi:hypothetical protein